MSSQRSLVANLAARPVRTVLLLAVGVALLMFALGIRVPGSKPAQLPGATNYPVSQMRATTCAMFAAGDDAAQQATAINSLGLDPQQSFQMAQMAQAANETANC